jgi:hypothetical protein
VFDNPARNAGREIVHNEFNDVRGNGIFLVHHALPLLLALVIVQALLSGFAGVASSFQEQEGVGLEAIGESA